LTVANYSTSIGPDQAPHKQGSRLEDRSRNRLQSSPRVPLLLKGRHNASNSTGRFLSRFHGGLQNLYYFSANSLPNRSHCLADSTTPTNRSLEPSGVPAF
jgi:hypothetical protein